MNTPAQVAPALSLRPYQIDAIAETRRRMARVRSVLINAPTGAGKTILGCQIIRLAVEKQRRVLFLAHRRELIDQCAAKLDERSEERRVGKECERLCRSRWSPYH